MTDQPQTPPRFAIRRPGSVERDILRGDPPLHERHRLARSYLLSHLSQRPEVQACFLRCAEEGSHGAAVQQVIEALEAQAQAAGLASRAALFTYWKDRYQAHLPPGEPWAADDPELDQLCDYVAPLQAFEAWRTTTLEAVLEANSAEHPFTATPAEDAVVTLADGLIERLGLAGDWLKSELFDWFFYKMMEGYILGAPSAEIVYLVEPIDPDQTVDLHIAQLPVHASPAEVAHRARVALKAKLPQLLGRPRGRMPKGPEHVERYVVWLLRHTLDAIPIGQLAREYLASEPAKGGDGHSQVQGGIEKACLWLNAIEVIPATETRNRKQRRRTQRQARRRNR